MFERDLPGENTMGFNSGAVSKLPLEMAETMNGSWGFNLIDDQFKSTRTLIRYATSSYACSIPATRLSALAKFCQIDRCRARTPRPPGVRR